MAGPLKGILIADFTVAVYGALMTQMLGDMGADVVKIEPPGGEFMRNSEGAVDNAGFLALNRSKRSLCVDLRDERGKEIVTRLVKKADVLAHNYRPGTMEKMGFGYADVVKMNPHIVYSSQSGFGERGPLARWIGGDHWAQAWGGMESVQGTPNTGPAISPVAVVDQGGPAITALGIVLALWAREKTGKGQRVNTSLLHSVLHLQSWQMARYTVDGKLLTRAGRGLAGSFGGGPYTASDGDVYTMADWPALCKVVGLDYLVEDPRYDTPEKRYEHREDLYPLFDAAFQKHTRAQWQQIFRDQRAGIRCDPCLRWDEALSHPQVLENDMTVEVKHSKRGKLRFVSTPIEMEGTPREVSHAPPLLGEHSEEVLAELGYSQPEIASLREAKVIGVAS